MRVFAYRSLSPVPLGILLLILQRLAQERPLEAGPALPVLWETVMQGRMRLQRRCGNCCGQLVERWHDLVRSQLNPKVPVSTNGLEGWVGRCKPKARRTRGLKTEAGPSTSRV